MTDQLLTRLLEKLEGRFHGKYRGLVVDNDDPEKRGRLRVRVPSVLGEEVVTGWALPCAAHGGAADQGFFFVPEKGAGVWVEFEAGQAEYPIWVGTFWSKPGGNSEVPRPNKPDGASEDAAQGPPTRKIIKTLKGHTIQLEDKDDAEMILVVEAKNKHVVVLDKAGIKVTDGVNKHVVTFDENGVQATDGVSKHVVTLDKSGVKVTDGVNKHEVALTASGIEVTDGKNAGNKITLGAAGVEIADKNANKVTLGALGIQIGDGASEPLVLGNQLDAALKTFLTMLNTHTHPTAAPGAPTGPPVAPMQLVLQPALSVKNKTM